MRNCISNSFAKIDEFIRKTKLLSKKLSKNCVNQLKSVILAKLNDNLTILS